MKEEFKNVALTDFSVKENREKMEENLKYVSSQIGKEYPIIIGERKAVTQEKLKSYNPANKNQVIGVFQKGTPSLAEEAIKVADEHFESWRWIDPSDRAEYLFKAAEVIRRRRLEFNAWEIFECGKNWVEADADIAEAIDFLEFYGREMIRYAQPQPLTKSPLNEKNELKYIPLGVGIIIPPWNFPLAIPVGMVSAAVVTGNTVVLKPSSDSPTVAAKFIEVLEEIKLPPGVVNFLTGGGEDIGDALVTHPRTRFISFTGSKEVGLRIYELAAKPSPRQIWIKKVIVEMGGKNAIIVDNVRNLDEAVEGVIVSAFGFQGQKCSACSRAVVVEGVYDSFVEKLLDKANKITVGPPQDPANYMGPVINKRAMESIMNYIETGKEEGRLVAGGERAAGNGYFIKPTIIVDVDPMAKVAQEEIFGPVVAVIKAKDFDHALQIANSTEYSLTGSVYTDDNEKIEKAKKMFHVGNLYFNRKCTGALVGVHPFGGFNMSGTDSKAGGRDYLLLHMQAKAIAEKLKR